MMDEDDELKLSGDEWLLHFCLEGDHIDCYEIHHMGSTIHFSPTAFKAMNDQFMAALDEVENKRKDDK